MGKGIKLEMLKRTQETQYQHDILTWNECTTKIRRLLAFLSRQKHPVGKPILENNAQVL